MFFQFVVVYAEIPQGSVAPLITATLMGNNDINKYFPDAPNIDRQLIIFEELSTFVLHLQRALLVQY